MHMQIDESGREIVPVEIERVGRRSRLANPGDLSFRLDDLKSVADAIRENEAPVFENHIRSLLTRASS